jgi:hypothetical protein
MELLELTLVIALGFASWLAIAFEPVDASNTVIRCHP